MTAPWSKEDAERKALELYPDKSGRGYDLDAENLARRNSFFKGLTWAAEMIDASPTLYSNETDVDWWLDEKGLNATHQAKLVGVKPIDHVENSPWDMEAKS